MPLDPLLAILTPRATAYLLAVVLAVLAVRWLRD
jgi:hypothetical protein